MRSFHILLAVLTFGAMAPAFAGTPLADGFKKLTGPQIKHAFSGKQFTDEVHFRLDYKANGEIGGFGMGKKVADTWRVESDQLCITEERRENCFFVWKKGGDVRLTIDDSDISTDGRLE